MVLASYPNRLNPKWPDLEWVREADSSVKNQMKKNHDRKHGAKALKIGSCARVKTNHKKNIGPLQGSSQQLITRIGDTEFKQVLESSIITGDIFTMLAMNKGFK